jgi:hypothetical protein
MPPIAIKYAAYCNEARTHVSLGKDAPSARMIERFGDIVSCPILADCTTLVKPRARSICPARGTFSFSAPREEPSHFTTAY